MAKMLRAVSERFADVLSGKGLCWAGVALIDLALLYVVTLMYAQGEIAFAMVILIIASLGTWIFTSQRTYNLRYVFPSLLGVFLFVVFPLIYTVNVSLTNYSSSNLLTYERVKDIIKEQQYSGGDKFTIALFQENEQYQLQLSAKNDKSKIFVTDVFTANDKDSNLNAVEGVQPAGDKLPMSKVIKMRSVLKTLSVSMPDNKQVIMTSLREFGVMLPLYSEGENGELINNRTGVVASPDFKTGFYTTTEGEQLKPGFTVYTGLDNYENIMTNKDLQGPFLQILGWTIMFSALSVLFTLIVGLLLACLVQWEPLKESAIYRVLLILPYAVPAFISILIFRGLFNQNFGEINMMLNALFGISPEWFSNEYLAKTMILMVNTWLGYPYMMILCMGLLKAIPEDLYEASAIDGATPLQNLWRITVPMIMKPLAPLLIASFAFNFNNFVLISLLTGGMPNIIDAATPAGTTDLLVSYTFRLAFGTYTQDFGLASAIAGLIFVVVGAIAWANLKVTRISQEQ